MIEKQDALAMLHRMFFDADEASRDERKEAEQARDYYDGKQYTHQELSALAKRNQPPTTLNRVARKINHLAGIEVERRTDPKALARTEQHEQAAEAATDALRYVEEKTKLDQKFSAIHDNMLVEGYGAVEMTIEEVQRKGEVEYDIKPVVWKWDRLFYDPHSVLHDFSDAQYVGGVEWLDYDVAKRRWPEKVNVLEQSKGSPSASSITDEYDDEPEKKAWVTQGSRVRVRIVHMYYQSKGEWWISQFTGGGVLINRKVPFLDEEGKSWCPMKMRSAYVDRDGDRYGEVRNLISPQDMINKAHSKLQHLTQTRQIIAEEGAFSEEYGGIDRARQELTKPDGVIMRQRGYDFEIQSTADIVNGHASLLQEYKQEIDLMGPNASMQGKGPQSQSGRALLAQTEGGMREFTPLADRFSELKEEVYRAIWLLVRQYWTSPKWIRVTDNESNTKFVGLNQPVTRIELAERKMRENGATDQDIEEIQQRVQSNPVFAYEAQQVAQIDNNVEEIDVDIMIETGPDTATLQSEQFEQLASLAPSLAQAGQPIPAKVIIRASQLRNKEDLIKEMEGGGQKELTPQEEQAAQQQQQIQQQQIELAVQEALAKIEKEKSIAAKNFASAERDEAETIKIMATPIEPQRISA